MRQQARAGLRVAALILSAPILAAIGASPASAAPITVEGVTFSDEMGDFTLEQVTGKGSLDDPFIVVENITGNAPMLIIRGLTSAFGNRIGSQHVLGMAIAKLAINHTGHAWNQFRLEVRTEPNTPSPYDDGLSFAQGWKWPYPARSHGFDHAVVTDEPYDAIDFDKGLIPDGGSASFDFFVTDMTQRPQIYLLQEPVRAVACELRSSAQRPC